MYYEKIKIKNILFIVKRRWITIIETTLIITIIASIINFFFIVPKYSTYTKLFIGKDVGYNNEYSSIDITMYQLLLKTYSELITTKDLAKKAMEEANLDVSDEEVTSSLIVKPIENTQMISINYTNENKVLAKKVMDAITNEFIQESEKIIPNGTVKIIESAKLPMMPSVFSNTINIIFGAVLGLICGLVLALVLEYIDDTFNTKEELENIMDIPVIGVILYQKKI